jgi:tetratricopeptide (TPR) repeat protein
MVFVVSLGSYLWSLYSVKRERKKLERFFRRFETEADPFIEAIEEQDSRRALLVLADAMTRSGDYQRAVAIYMRLQKEAPMDERIKILVKLADLYFRAGFLQRSRDIYEEVLGFMPRHREALRSLLLVYERLGEYDGAMDVLESLAELGEDISKERGYFDALVAARRGDLLRLQKIYTKKKAIRAALEPLFLRDPAKAWEVLRAEDIPKVIDLLWQLPKDSISTHLPLLRQIYGARGDVDGVEGSEVFELDVVLRHPLADLGFGYVCKSCKRRFPLPFGRCVSCGAVEEMDVEMRIVKKREINEAGLSF